MTKGTAVDAKNGPERLSDGSLKLNWILDRNRAVSKGDGFEQCTEASSVLHTSRT